MLALSALVGLGQQHPTPLSLVSLSAACVVSSRCYPPMSYFMTLV